MIDASNFAQRSFEAMILSYRSGKRKRVDRTLVLSRYAPGPDVQPENQYFASGAERSKNFKLRRDVAPANKSMKLHLTPAPRLVEQILIFCAY